MDPFEAPPNVGSRWHVATPKVGSGWHVATCLVYVSLLVSILADAVVADIDDIGGVVAPPADHQTGGTLQLGPVAVYHRVQAPLTHVEHLQK